MAENNGGGIESRLTKLELAQAQLEDAMLIHATLQANEAHVLKQHSAVIVEHDRMMIEMEGKLNALIDIVGKSQGGLESRPYFYRCLRTFVSR